MKKRLFFLLLLLVSLPLLLVPAFADQVPSRDDLYVTFTSGARMESNFASEGNQFTETASELQPGDYLVYTIELRNDHTGRTDWYMKNEVLHSLETASNTARGGAYTYVLSYTSPAGQQKEFYNSATVGGTSDDKGETEGLSEATSGLKDYFYVDRLQGGERASITLFVELDGESQGNDYQNTLADLKMQFAVELLENETTPGTTPSNSGGNPGTTPGCVVVRTGDDRNPKILFLLMFVSGLIGGSAALALAIDGRRQRRKEKQ